VDVAPQIDDGKNVVVGERVVQGVELASIASQAAATDFSRPDAVSFFKPLILSAV
jgi:hypothetical protein